MKLTFMNAGYKLNNMTVALTELFLHHRHSCIIILTNI